MGDKIQIKSWGEGIAMTMSNPLFEHTIFINLESRVDRHMQIKQELQRWGINEPIRFNAVKMAEGAIGCSMSHIKCLELAKERDYPHVFICEDDMCCIDIPTMMRKMEWFYETYGTTDAWDVLIVSGNNGPPYKQVDDGLLQVYNCQAATGYIVQRHYYDKIIANFREGLAGLIREPKQKPLYAVDMYWKHLQKKDRWFAMTPFTVVQRPSYSDIELKNVDYTHLMLDHEKRWLQQRMW
jgi:glycosyl transferase family 25